MTALVLLILGAVWAAVLVPPALRARHEASPGDSIGSFHHQLNILRRTGGYTPRPGYGEFGPVPVPRSHSAAAMAAGVSAPAGGTTYDLTKKRRRDVLVTLLWIMGGSLVLGMLPAFRGLLWLHVVADVLFAAYVALLLQIKRAADIERANVTRIPSRHLPDGVADLNLRRAVGD